MKGESNMSYQEKILSLQPCKDDLYSSIDLNSLATYAINWLLEHSIPTTFENIVVFLFKRFPIKFALEGYAIFPDSARVGRSLLQLGPKYRNWARGSVQRGFQLTEAGLTKATKVSQVITSGLPQAIEGLKKQLTKRTMDQRKDILVLEKSHLFARWKEGKLEASSTMDLQILLGAYAYTPFRAISDRAKILQETAVQAGRSDVSDFLKNVMKILKNRMGE